MFVYFKYFVLIVFFNHCFGASNLIPTAIYSSSQRHQQNRFHQVHLPQLYSDAASYYPVYSLPLGANPSPGELRYSASYTDPIVETKSKVNFQHLVQKPRTPPQPQPASHGLDNQRPNNGITETKKDHRVRFVPSQVQQKQVVPQPKPRQNPLPSRTQTLQTVNQKPMVPMILRAQISSATLTSAAPNSYFLNANTHPIDTRRPKSESNSTIAARVHSLRFNWPKTRSQTQQNDTKTQQLLHKELPLMSRTQTLAQHLPKVEYKHEFRNKRINGGVRGERGESEHNFRFDFTKSPQMLDTTELHTTEQIEISRVSTTSSPIESSYETTEVMTTEALQHEDVYNSDRKDNMSSVDSELNYQTQSFQNSFKLTNDNYDQNYENNGEIPFYGSPINEDSGIPIPENHDNYVHPEPEPEPVPEIDGKYVDPYEKDTYDEAIESTPQLKPLLEQFIQQLDLLKFVATKELQKSNAHYSSGYSSDGKVIHESNVDPSFSKTAATYGEYQNERSFEQNLSNTEGKTYKDTNEKNGRNKPCKKPFHAGALPHLGIQ